MRFSFITLNFPKMETIYIVTRNALIEPLPTHMVKEKSHETALIRYFVFMNGIKLLLQKKNPGSQRSVTGSDLLS